MRTALAALPIAAGALLSACISCETTWSCPAPSPAFLSIEGMGSPEAQARALRSKSIEERLDAYHDVYVRSGHPRTMLYEAFDGTGEVGFDAAFGRMTNRSSFNEYFWIIYWLGLRGEVDVCSPQIFDRLSAKARQFRVGDPKNPVPVEFDGCVLPL